MKKVFFSAIALIAFSFSGMANEEKNDGKNTVKGKSQKKESVIVRNNCDLAADAVYETSIALGSSVNTAYELSLFAYQQCINWHTVKDIKLIVF